MIGIEAARDGFVVLAGGVRTLVHSRHAPCIEIGRAELSYRRVRGSLCARRRRSTWLPLRDFSVVENSGERTTIDFGGLLRMGFSRESELLRLSFACSDPGINLFRIRLEAEPEEHIYGCGERRSRLDLKGRRIPLWVEETGSLREGDLGFLAAELFGSDGAARGVSLPLPVFVSSRNYWCAVDCPAYTVFDFRRKSSTVVETWALPRELTIGRRTDAVAVAADVSTVLGRQPPLPEWCHDGAWLALDLSGGVEAGRRRVDEVIAAGVKIGLIVDEGSLDPARPFTPRRPAWDSGLAEAQAGELREAVRHWRERGIRFLAHADPYLDPQGPRFAEASRRGFCVRGADGLPCLLPASSSQLALVDLSHGEALAWLVGLMAAELRQSGAVGFVADSGGRLPAEALLHSGADAGLLHNIWPLLWAKANAAALGHGAAKPAPVVPGRRPETFYAQRAGWLGSAPWLPAAFAGGRLSSFDREEGLPSVIPAAISLGLCGLGSVHSEVGGSPAAGRSRRGLECVERWMEVAAFSPVFRIRDLGQGEAKGAGMGEAWLASLARMTEIHAALKPYHLAVAEEYRREGLPALRHPFVHYEDEAELHGRDYQYLYGRDLIFAPALASGKEFTELWLPREDWIHIWSSRNFKGGLVTVESPLGCPAVFYRSSSPFASLFDSIRRTTRRP